MIWRCTGKHRAAVVVCKREHAVMHLGCYLIDDWQEGGIECRVVSRMQSPGTLNVDTDVCALLFIDTSQRRPIWAWR
jgi:hypothetical protein